jgi:hypothetical protein
LLAAFLAPVSPQPDYARVKAAFEAGWDGVPLPAPGGATRSAPIDLGDGQTGTVELLQPPGASSDTLDVYEGAGDGGPPLLHLSLGFVARSLLVQDLDGDGQTDVFAAGPDLGQAALLLGRGDGTFDVFSRDGPRASLAVADLTGSHRDDFVLADGLSDRLWTQVAGAAPQVVADGRSGMFGPDDIRLADLNGDGIPDLVVTCASAGVLVFPGLGGGRFGPEAHGGRGLAVGLGPLHATFAPLGPGGGLDMVVASEGKDEVAVLQVQPDWGLKLSQLLDVGLAPTSVLVADVTGDGRPDLVVTEGGDNAVRILPGLGGGRFDDQHPRVLPTGAHPFAAFVGNFDGDRRPDLVTLDAGSSTLTFYPDVASPATRPRTLDSGGVHPVSALVRDVNGDGVSDLIVANHDDGRLALFLGGDQGPALSQTMASPGGQPTAVAAASQPTSPWQFYVLAEGSTSAELVGFQPQAAVDTQHPDEPAPELKRGPARTEAALEPLSPASIDLVPTLITPHEDDGRASRPAGGTPAAPLVPPPGVPAGPAPGAAGEEAAEPAEGEGARPAAVADELKVRRFLLGADEAAAPPVSPDGRSQREPAPAADAPPPPPPRPVPPDAPVPVVRVGDERPAAEGGPAEEERPEEGGRLAEVALLLAAGGLALELERRSRPAGLRGDRVTR